MTANKGQVGGNHYAAEYQHWDWTADVRMLGLEYAATKYLSRWWKKNGLEDLRKPYHYMQKALELVRDESRFYRNRSLHVSERKMDRVFAETCFQRFVQSADIPPHERGIMHAIANWQTDSDIELIQKEINLLLIDASAGLPVRACGGGTGHSQQQSKAAGGLADGVFTGNPTAIVRAGPDGRVTEVRLPRNADAFGYDGEE